MRKNLTQVSFNAVPLAAARLLLAVLFYFMLPGAIGQNVFSGEPVQWVGRPNGYSTEPYNSDYRTLVYRKLSTTTSNPNDGRGQWATTINVQTSGGNIAPDNMPGGINNGAGWLFISGPPGGRFNNKWGFNGVGQAALNAVNSVVKQGAADMGLNMGTSGYYTFVMRDAGYVNTEFYVGYTAAAPVTVSLSGQTFNSAYVSTINIATSASPSSGEGIFVRYRAGTNDFTTGTSVVQASGSGTSWSATIPAQACGSTVYYYIFTSTRTLSQIQAHTEGNRSFIAMRYSDNGGNNHSYTTPATASAGVVSGASTLCIGASSTYTSTGNAGGAWSSTNGSVATVDPNSGIVTGVSAGSTNITYTVNAGCGTPVSASQPLTVSPNANAGTVSGTSPLTVGASVTYSSTGDAGGTWSSTNTSVATVDPNTGVVNATGAGSTNITYTVSAGCNAPVSSFQPLTVTAPTNAGVVSGTTPLCIGATATYSSTGTSGGTWSSTNPSVATVNPNTGVVTTLSAGTTDITYTVSGPSSAFHTLTVNPNVNAGSVTGTSPLCVGATAIFASNGNAGGTWSSSDGTVASVNINTGEVTALAEGTTNITYTINSGCGSPASAFQVLQVNKNVNPGTVTGTSPLCIGATATYSTDGDPGGTWSSTNTSVATIDANTGVVTAISGGTTNITYTNNSGCGAPASAFAILTVQSSLDYVNLQFPGAGTICSNGSLTAYGQVYEGGLTEAAGPGAGIVAEIGYNTSNTDPSTWTNWSPATFNVQSGNNDEYMGTIGNGFAPGTYYFTFRYSLNGCGFQYGGYNSSGGNSWNGSNYVSGVLTVNANADAGTVSGTSPLCINGSAQYTATGDAGGTWSSSNTSVAIVDAGTGVVTALSGGSANIIYTLTSGCNSPVSSFQEVTVTGALSAPGPLSGPINACPYVGTGEQVTYSVPALQGATSYTWVVPPTVTIVSGQGTNSITVTFSAGFTAGANKQLRVTALSSCGNSPQATFILVAQLPGTPKPIIASSGNVCGVIGTAGTITYTIPKVTAATSYSWITQAGTTAVSHPNGLGVNDTVVTVSFTNGFTTSAITVQAVNECGTTAARSLTITRNNPATPGPITGPSNACPYIAPNGTAAAYSVNAVANATSYTWTIPANSTGLTGQGTPSISFTYPAGFTSGSVSVTTTNGCGTSGARTLSITKLNPATPGVIDVVQNSACPNRSYSYTISALPSNATSIQWTVPSGATLVSGQGTTSITVSYPATAVSGAVTAQAVNNCGVSVIRSITVKLPACTGGRPEATFSKGMTEPVVNEEAAEAMSVNVFPNPSITDFKLQVITAGKEKIEVRILDLQGRQVQKINVMAYQTISIGNELKAGSYMIEVRQGKEVKIMRVIRF